MLMPVTMLDEFRKKSQGEEDCTRVFKPLNFEICILQQ